MTMRYKSKCVCQTLSPEERKESFLISHSSGVCWMCHGKGENEYDLSLENIKIQLNAFSPVKFYSETPEESTDADLVYDDISVSIRCSCGDEVYLSGRYEVKVCSCGRIYRIDVDISKDDTHKGDMEYWDKIKNANYE